MPAQVVRVCFIFPAFTIAPATVATTTDTPSEVLSTSEPPQQVQLIGISQQKLLSIVIPVAFVTILVVLIIVILGVIVCVKFRGQNSSGRHFQRQRSTIKILDNTVLYQSADPYVCIMYVLQYNRSSVCVATTIGIVGGIPNLCVVIVTNILTCNCNACHSSLQQTAELGWCYYQKS